MVVKREKTKKQWYQSVESIFKVQSSLIENSSQHLTGRELTTLLKTFDSGDSAYDRLMHVGRGETSNSRALSDSEEKSQVPSTTDELITPHASRKRDDSELSDSDKRNKSTKKEEKEDEETTAGRSPVSPKPQLISIGKEKSTKVDLPKKEAQKKGVEGKKKSPSPVISPRRASLRQKLGGVEETREKV